MLAREVSVTHLLVRINSQFIIAQITRSYLMKDSLPLKYLQRVQQLAKGFVKFEVFHIPREENAGVNLLAQLASTKGPGFNR